MIKLFIALLLLVPEISHAELSSYSDNVVLLYHFNEGSGTKPISFGKIIQSTATLSNGALWGQGKFGTALFYPNGNGENCSIPFTNYFKSSTFTYAIWFWGSDSYPMANIRVLWGQGFGSLPMDQYAYLSTTGKIVFGFNDVQDSNCDTASSTEFTFNEIATPRKWNHAVFRLNNRKVDVFLNGKKCTPFTNQLSFDKCTGDTNVMFIGTHGGSATACWKGFLDEWVFINKALTDGDCMRLYEQGKAKHSD